MKKLLAALCAIAVVLSIAGCQNVKISVSTTESSASSVSEASSQASTSKEEVSSVTNSVVESSNEESSKEESKIENSSVSGHSLDYVGDTYKISANEKWEATSTSGTDCAYKYVAASGLEQGTIVGVQTITAGISTFTLDEFADAMIAQYENMDFKVLNKQQTKFKNMDAYLIEVSNEDMDGMILRQIMFKTDKAMYVFHITYVKSVYDNVKNEIDEVLDTFELIG